MMKRIIATTAMALMLGTSAFAANTGANSNEIMMQTYASEQPGDIYASKFIGMRIYSAESQWDAWDENARAVPGAEKEWDDIGEVNDVILGANGQVKAVILGIGGFIGIGEKDIAVPMDQIKMVREEGNDDDYFLVVKTNKEMLTEATPFDRTDDMQTGSVTADDADHPADKTGRLLLPRPMIDRDGYREAEMTELTAEKLEGISVYGINDESVGEIDRLILSEDGKVETVVIDVGGFLGLGEHPVGVTFDELRILRNDNGDDLRVYIDSSEEALGKQPAYKG
tara:strand:+ start:162 stop:1010 length:849 start_codon:yes stop_codon:yes gene_type:complete